MYYYPWLRNVVQTKLAEEDAAVRLAVVAGPYILAEVMPEVERRKELFEKRWQESARSGGPTTTPRCAALESVYQDVIRGWL